ncbi:hypothetical protein H0H93_015544 [Arthromyces matolae]|nr:hypothetical protein H0H93_015544 [Arthromyces matolae]
MTTVSKNHAPHPHIDHRRLHPDLVIRLVSNFTASGHFGAGILFTFKNPSEGNLVFRFLLHSSNTLGAVDEYNFDAATASLENVHVRRETVPMASKKRRSAVVKLSDANEEQHPDRHSLINGHEHKPGSVVVYSVPTELVEKAECTVTRFFFCLVFWGQIAAFMSNMIISHAGVVSMLFGMFGIPTMFRNPPGDCMGCTERMYGVMVDSLSKLHVETKRAGIILSNALQLCAHDTKMGAISALENAAGVVCGAAGIQRPDFSQFKTPPPLPHPVPPRKSGIYPSASGQPVELSGVTIDTEPLLEAEPESKETSHGLLAPPIADSVDDRRERQLSKIREKIAKGHGDHVVTWNELHAMGYPVPPNHSNTGRDSSPNSGRESSPYSSANGRHDTRGRTAAERTSRNLTPWRSSASYRP